MTGLLRQPALHFFAIGGLLFAADTWIGREPGFASLPPPELLSPERIERLRADWLATTGTPPGPEETAALIRAEQDDELWIAEARRRGFHRSDPVARRRMVRNMRFVAGSEAQSDEQLVGEALRLGMDRSDPVVRRRLVQVMKLGVTAAARTPEPHEAALLAHLEANAERFTRPGRVALSQIYLSRDRRGERLADDAQALFERLAEESAGPDTAGDRGDPFLIPPHLPSRSLAELSRNFGPGFAEVVAATPPGVWSRPVPSSYGLHLVWVHERSDASLPELDAVRTAVRESLLSERGDRALARALEELRASR